MVTNFNTSWSGRCLFGKLQNGMGDRILYRIKNKEQWSKYTAQSWLGIWGLADCICCVYGKEAYLQGTWKLSWVSVCWWGTPGRSVSILGLEIYFNTFNLSFMWHRSLHYKMKIQRNRLVYFYAEFDEEWTTVEEYYRLRSVT